MFVAKSNHMKSLSLQILLLLLTKTGTIAQTIIVPTDQPTIQAGLNAASSGTTVMVAPGTYYENIVWPNTSGINLVAIGDTSNTIIDGSLSGRVINIKVIDQANATSIKGFTVRNGYDQNDYFAGGIHCDSSYLRIENCHIHSNKGWGLSLGSGMSIIHSTVNIIGCLINHNSSDETISNGIGIYIENGSDVTIDNSIVSDNYSLPVWKVFGAGVFIGHSNLIMTDSDISGNMASVSETGESRGVGITAFYQSHVLIENCRVNGNSCSNNGNSMGTGILVSYDSDLTLNHSEVNDNISGSSSNYHSGGAICGVGATITINNTSVINNIAHIEESVSSINGGSFRGFISVNGILNIDGLTLKGNQVVSTLPSVPCYGIGIYVSENSGRIVNTLIAENTINGAIDNAVEHSIICGNMADSLTILHSTVAGNFHNVSGENSFSAIRMLDKTSFRSVNSIIWNPSLSNEISADNALVSHSDVRGGFSGMGNLNEDPHFWGNGNYNIAFPSPCINSGDPFHSVPTDMYGNPRPRPVGTNPDMGSVEDDNQFTEISRITASAHLEAIPNPNSGTFKLMIHGFDIESPNKIKIIDFSGREIDVNISCIGDNVFNIEGLESGIFSVILFDDDLTIRSVRVVVRK